MVFSISVVPFTASVVDLESRTNQFASSIRVLLLCFDLDQEWEERNARRENLVVASNTATLPCIQMYDTHT
jgi:hypothetical protein